MRQHYALDTAALLLAGADPTSIDTEQPETVLVSQAIYSFKYHREAESWRSRLVYAGLCGELSVSIDNQLGFVAAWENDYRWVPIPIDKAFAQVQCCELHSPDIFFDIEREALAVWVGDQGVTLPSWLENDAKLTLHTQPNDRWWYVIPLRWAFASGRLPNTGTARQILGEIKDKAGTNSNSKAQREALETARNNTELSSVLVYGGQ